MAKIKYEDFMDKASIDAGFNELVSTIKNLKDELKSAVSAANSTLKTNKGNTSEDVKKQKEAIDQINAAEKTRIELETKLASILAKKEAVESGLNDKILQETEALKRSNAERKYATQLANSSEGSYNKLAAQYNLNKMALNGMSTEMRKGTVEGQKLEAETNAIYSEMKKLQESTGKFVLSVGDYAQAGKSFRTQLRETKQELVALIASGASMSDEKVVQLSKKYDTLTDNMTKAKNAAEISDTSGKIGAMVKTVGTLAAGYEVAQGAAALFGVENENLQKTFVKIQAAMAVANGLEQISNSLKGESVVVTFAQAAASKVAAAAQWLWNAAMTANPIGLVIVIVAALGAAIYGLSKILTTTTEKQEYYNKVGEITAKYTRETAEALKDLKAEFADVSIELAVATGKMDEYTAAILRNNMAGAKKKEALDPAYFKAITIEQDKMNAAIEKINSAARVKNKGHRLMDKDIEKWANEEIQKVIQASIKERQGLTKKHNELKKQIDDITNAENLIRQESAQKELENNYREYLANLEDLRKKHRDAHVSLITDEQKKEQKTLFNAFNDELDAIDKINVDYNSKQKAKNDAFEIYQQQLLNITEKYNDLKLKEDNEAAIEEENNKTDQRARDLENYKWYVEGEKLLIEKKYADKKDKSGKEQELLNLELTSLQYQLDNKLIKQYEYDREIKKLGLTQAEIDAVNLDKKLKAEKELRDAIIESTEVIAQSFIKRSEAKQKGIDKEIDASKKQEDYLRALATSQVEGAKENLAFEQQEQAKLEVKRQKEIQKQKRIEMGLAALNLYSNMQKSGDGTSALPRTISEITKLLAFINTIPAFKDGIVAFGGRHKSAQPDDTLAMIGKGESVIKAVATDRYHDHLLAMQNMTYNPLDYVDIPRFSNDSKESVESQLMKKIDNLNETIKNKQEYSINVDALTHEIVERVKKGNTEIVNIYKRKPFLG